MPYAAVNGLNMYYEVHGEGPPLLLLHGGSGSIPEKWIPFFSPRFQVIAMEQMGHGRTADLGDRPFHYHDMAEDTVELMRQLKVESAVVVGYSDGGIIGLDIAIHHPERVTKLAVTGANYRTEGYTAENLEWARSFDPMPRRCPRRTPACLPTAPAIGRSSSVACSEQLDPGVVTEPSGQDRRVDDVREDDRHRAVGGEVAR
jgi:pimeloyl-ACP methyl ester carboxylesterase